MTAAVTTSHERKERLRERMLAAADEFLSAEGRAHEAVQRFASTARELLTASAQITAVVDETPGIVGAWSEGVADAEPGDAEAIAVPPVYERALQLVRWINSVTAIGQEHGSGRRAKLDAALIEVDHVLGELSAPQHEVFGPIREHTQRMLVTLARFKLALQRYPEAWEACGSALDGLLAARARQALLLGGDARSQELARAACDQLNDAAWKIASVVAVTAADDALNSVAQIDRGTREQPEWSRLAGSSTIVEEYAARVSRRLRSARP